MPGKEIIIIGRGGIPAAMHSGRNITQVLYQWYTKTVSHFPFLTGNFIFLRVNLDSQLNPWLY